MPTVAFINKLDRLGADFDSVIRQMNERLEVKTLLLQIPYYEGDAFRGVVDLVEWRLLVWDEDSLGATFQVLPVPDNVLEEAGTARDSLLEALADYDDQIMEQYLAERYPTRGRSRRPSVRSPSTTRPSRCSAGRP